MENSAVAVVISVPLILAGLAGLVLPVLPGPILIWLGIVVYGLMVPDLDWSWWFFVIEGLLAASTYLVDYLTTIWGVRKFNGSKAAAIGAVLGSLMIFFIGPLGIIIGPFLGAMAGELIAGSELKQMFTSGFGTFLGFIVAMFIKMFICGIMLSWFVIKVVSSWPGGPF